MIARVTAAITRPAKISQIISLLGRMGSRGSRGLSLIRPSRGLPYPRPTARNTWTVKFTYRVWSGRNGVPWAMNSRLAPRNVAMKPNRPAIWNRM